MDMLPGRTLLLFPLFMLLATFEGLYLQRRRTGGYDWRAYFATLGDVAGRLVFARLLGTGLSGLVLALAYRHRVTSISMHAWWAWPLLLVLQDLCYYWMHRADHRVHWFWASHCVHHSTNGYNFSAAYRLGWTAKFTGSALFFVPLALVGFPVPAILIAVAGNLFYQFWLHTELVPRLGPLEWVFNTPAHHRVHHASNAGYVDRNYGGVLIVFDRLFGTFAREREDDPCRYGLVHPLLSNHPLRIAFHGWAGLWRAFRDAYGWRGRWTALFGPPQ
ncbi:MAG TPA: sterol desaturase family protein [Luteibacter sp.]|jgi:sterol desaturase/sphingolipid hydroxylase (fatty acid hydroxylase superfamily)|nr:sterol desaturase family protein [Luteibacter sp.]